MVTVNYCVFVCFFVVVVIEVDGIVVNFEESQMNGIVAILLLVYHHKGMVIDAAVGITCHP